MIGDLILLLVLLWGAAKVWDFLVDLWYGLWG